MIHPVSIVFIMLLALLGLPCSAAAPYTVEPAARPATQPAAHPVPQHSARPVAQQIARSVSQQTAYTLLTAEHLRAVADPVLAESLVMGKGLHEIDFTSAPAPAASETRQLTARTADPFCRFRPRQLIAPVSLAALGALAVGRGPLHGINDAVQEQMTEWSGGRRLRADDWLQYLPVAANLGLGLTGVRARHTFGERAAVTVTAYLAMGVMVNCLKWTVGERRPDSGSLNSFPSGHTATVFMGAELVRSEYGLGCGIAAYAVAGGVAFLRLYNNRHWMGDVLAGAGIGILSARIGYWLLPLSRRLFRLEGRRTVVASAPTFDPITRTAGVAFCIVM